MLAPQRRPEVARTPAPPAGLTAADKDELARVRPRIERKWEAFDEFVADHRATDRRLGLDPR